MPNPTTETLTEVLEGDTSLPEIARKLGLSLSDFLDWFFTDPVQRYIKQYRAANHLIAQARASAHAAALIDRLRQQMGHPDPGLSIRASTALARFVFREMPSHQSRKSTPESEAVRRQPLPAQPGYVDGLKRSAANWDKLHHGGPLAQTASHQAAASSDSKAPIVNKSPDRPSPPSHPAQAHPAPRDATPQPPSSAHSPVQPTPPQTPAPARERSLLRVRSRPPGRTTPPAPEERAASAA